jgi:tetratricopeptide (TPR) repeat protein
MTLAARPEEKAEVNRRIGSLYYQIKNYTEAEKAYLAVVAAEKEASANDVLESLNNLAYLYASDWNQPEKALPYAEKALKNRPDDGNIQDTMGWTLVKLKRLSDAQPYLESALETRTAAAFYHLGFLREQQGRLSDASKMYRLASEKLRDQKDDPLYQVVADSLKRVQQKPESK